MNKQRNYKLLPFLVLAAGAVALGLYVWLMGTENDKGFIDKFHMSAICLLGLTGIVVATVFIFTRNLVQGNKYQFNFPASNLGGLGAWVAAAGIMSASLLELPVAGDKMAFYSALVGIFAAVALIFVGYCRMKGLHPNVLAHVVICVHLMLRLIVMYRQWSADPQLYDYCFRLLAVVCAMLAVYQRACFDANCGKRSDYTFFNLMSIYFSVICLGGSDRILYLAIGVWLFTDMCNLTPMQQQPAEETNEAA